VSGSLAMWPQSLLPASSFVSNFAADRRPNEKALYSSSRK
jgi:hypothetical protein